MHGFRKRHPVVRTMVRFVVITTVLCSFIGPTGILYALGFEVLYLLTYLLANVFGELLGPDIY
jgi:hypothetical protein